MSRRISLLAVVLLASASLFLGAHAAQGQAQGVGVTVTNALPSPAPSSSVVPSSARVAAGDNGGASVLGNRSVRGASGSNRLPATGLEIARLLAIALALVTAGELMVRLTKRSRAASY